MNSQQKFLVGLAAGASAAFAGSRMIRRGRAIDFAGRVVVITGGSRGGSRPRARGSVCSRVTNPSSVAPRSSFRRASK